MQRREEEEDVEYFPPGFRWRRKSRRLSENHASSVAFRLNQHQNSKEKENSFEMERGQEDIPPGFSSGRRKTRSSLENNASPNRSNELSEDILKQRQGIQSINSPNIILKFRGEHINPNPAPSTAATDSQTRSPIPENRNSAIVPSTSDQLTENAKTTGDAPEKRNNSMVKSELIVINASDKGTIEGDPNETDIVSFQGENDIVYTLSDPPKARDLTRIAAPLIDAPSTVCVKKGLISFLIEASPNDVGHMITQANTIFTFLQGMNAEYTSFYNDVRAYICHCLDWYVADQELKKCKASEESVSRYDQLLHDSNEIKKNILVVEENIDKAKGYMAPLEARVVDMKELLEKLELELDERKNDLIKLEATKTQKVQELAALDVELEATATDAEKARGLIRVSTARRETAKIRLENVRSHLSIV